MEDDQHISATPSKQRFISKRSLKNKSVTIGFNEDDLRNYVTGFHKRKKKRRKEAIKQQDEAKRRKRIELRKKRKEEREYVTFGGAPPATDSTAEVDGEDEDDDDDDDDEDKEQVLSVSGTTTYDNGDLKVTVTTSEISREDEIIIPSKNTEKAQEGEEGSEPVSGRKKNIVPVAKKKPMKRVVQRKSRTKSHSRKDNKKGKKKGKGR